MEILAAQRATGHMPGTILGDINTLLGFIGADGSGKTRNYAHPDLDRAPSADEVKLGDCDLDQSLPLKFRNHGHINFEFLAKLERIEPPDPTLRSFKILETRGKANTRIY